MKRKKPERVTSVIDLPSVKKEIAATIKEIKQITLAANKAKKAIGEFLKLYSRK